MDGVIPDDDAQLAASGSDCRACRQQDGEADDIEGCHAFQIEYQESAAVDGTQLLFKEGDAAVVDVALDRQDAPALGLVARYRQLSVGRCGVDRFMKYNEV